MGLVLMLQAAVLDCLCLVPAFDFASGLRVEGCFANMARLLILQPFGQRPKDVTGSIVAEQTGFVSDHGLVAA